jgi:hypothetical protein
MIKIKEGVSILSLDNKLVLALIVADQVYHAYGCNECVLTSACDGKHGEHSLHYKGLAIDLRTRNVDPEMLMKIVNTLIINLGEEFDVILENDHIHIEFDPKQ